MPGSPDPDGRPPSGPDPRPAARAPWSLFGAGGLALLVAVCLWVLAGRLHGLLHAALVIAAVAVSLYAAYVLLLAIGWQLLSRAFDAWSDRRRRRAALDEGVHLLELRFGGDEDPVTDLHASVLGRFIDGFSADVDCGEASSTGGAFSCYLRGRDLDRMLAEVRRAAADVTLPSDAYLWVPDLARPGHGRVLPLHPGP